MAFPYVIDNYDLESFLTVASNFGDDHFGYVVTPNVDHLIRFHDEATFRSLYTEAAFVLLDSRFLSHVLWLTKGLKVNVCTGSDLTAQLFKRVIRPKDRVVLIGGSDEQAQQLAKLYGLGNLAHHNPPMGFTRDQRALNRCLEFIEEQGPFRFCFLAVGCPQQEIVAQQLKARGKARGLALCIGASINFLTGIERRAPNWMQSLGAEWLFRLLQNPRRLTNRYLVRGPRVFSLLYLTDFLVRPLKMPVASRTITKEVGP